MAGTAKPASAGYEAKYKVISVLGSQGSGGTVENPALFDGIQVDEWNTGRVMYWYYDNKHHITLEIKETCNIWRSGTKEWSNLIDKLFIEQVNSDGTYSDITALYPQTLSLINNTQWEKTIQGLPPGTYRFRGGNSVRRLDSEWYIEAVVAPKFLLQSTNGIYTIRSSVLQKLDDTDDDKSALFSQGFESLTKENCELIAQELGKAKIIKMDV